MAERAAYFCSERYRGTVDRPTLRTPKIVSRESPTAAMPSSCWSGRAVACRQRR